MAIAVVGAVLQAANSAAGATLATAARAVTTGNAVVVNIKWEFGGTISSVTDTAGNTYTIIEQGGTTPGQALAYCVNMTGHASNVITVTWSNALSEWRNVQCYFFSGVATASPVDGTATTNTGTTTPATSAGVTSTGDAVFFYGIGFFANCTPTWPGTFVGSRSSDGSAALGYDIVTGAATRTASVAFTGGPADWRIGVFALKAASGAATKAPPRFNRASRPYRRAA